MEPPGEIGLVEIDVTSGVRVSWRWRSLVAGSGLRLPVLAPAAGEVVLDGAGSWQEPTPLHGRRAARLPRAGIAAIAFDWNGTLVDDGDQAWRATVEILARRLLPEIDRARFSEAFRLPLATFFESLGVHDSLAAAREWNERMSISTPVLAPDVASTLRGLRRADVALGVVSAAALEVVTAQIETCGLADLLDFVIAGPAPKRDPLIRLNRLAPGRVAYLGDTEYDIHEAVAAGVRALGWAGGYRPAVALLAAGAERVLEEMGELASLVRRQPTPPFPAS